MQNRTYKLVGSALSVLGLAILMLTGCGKSNSALESNAAKAFQSADAPTKAIWDATSAALKTNGYAPALIGLQNLINQPNLTEDQRQAVTAFISGLNDKLVDAASKGDPQAIEALKATRGSFRR